jgi:sigma-B regulation protein RsbU (phosphoserine phosphatase)
VTPAPAAPAERNIKVLLVDDQRMVGEAIRRMLLDIPGLEYRFCADPAVALAEADAFRPTVILQDLIMPGADGIDMVRAFRAHPATAATPIVVLSSKEEAATKAEAFAAGANDYLVKLPDKLEVVARIRYHSAAYTNRLQRDEAYTALEAQQQLIARELADAAAYVRSLLPAPFASLETKGLAADWSFIPSSSLGGDSFGYHWLTPHQLAIYLLDVCGHGVGSALLSVTAINTLRNRTLPDTDFTVPSQVLTALNDAFQMDAHGGKYFTMWYGVFDTRTAELTHAAGGHPPAIAIQPDGTVLKLPSSGIMVGAFRPAMYTDRVTPIPPGTRLFLFSDGCYEVFDAEDNMMSFEQFTDVLAAAAPHADALDRVVAAARAWQDRSAFDDDFSLVELRL